MKGKNEVIRKIYWTKEFAKFYEVLPNNVRLKFEYVLSIVETERIISSKFVKHIVNTDLYEMRVSVGNNEYRTILFTMDHSNVILATEITLLNAFLKKSTKDYKKQIKLAEKILNQIITAVPKPGCRFLCWTDGITTPARDVVLKESELSAHKVTKTYSALFAPIALYAGATPISEIYVGTKKAKVYRGSTRIL